MFEHIADFTAFMSTLAEIFKCIYANDNTRSYQSPAQCKGI